MNELVYPYASILPLIGAVSAAIFVTFSVTILGLVAAFTLVNLNARYTFKTDP